MNNYLVISSEFPPGPGGIGKHAYSLIKSLVKYDVRVDVICDMDYAGEQEIAQFIESHRPAGINITRIRRQGAYTYIDRVLKAISAVRENNYKKVIITGKFSIWTGGILKVLFGRKVHMECFIHGSEARLASGIQRSFTYFCLRRMQKLWAVSKFTKSLIPGDILRLNTTSVLPNGINIEDWPYTVAKTGADWKGYPRLLTVGSVSRRKGQHCVIKALPDIIKKYPDAHYHIVGLAKNTEYITGLAEELNVSDHITVHGKLSPEDLIKAYQQADIFCMLSENQANGEVEGFGIAILEANIMGKPAIGSKGCGIEDAIDPGYNGYLANPANATEVVNAVDLLLKQDPDRLKNNCVAWAKKHDWDVLAKELL